MRASRHIARVEWVTDQVRRSHSRGGAEKVDDDDDGEVAVVYFEGERRVTVVGGDAMMLCICCKDVEVDVAEVEVVLRSLCGASWECRCWQHYQEDVSGKMSRFRARVFTCDCESKWCRCIRGF